MIFELTDSATAEPIFCGWNDTMIRSCLQQVMGRIFVIDTVRPKSACASLGCFAFYAGEPDTEIAGFKPSGFTIMTPQNEHWSELIERFHPAAEKNTRYAFKKGTSFNRAKLNGILKSLPAGYALEKIDGKLYDQCLTDPLTADFVSLFGSKERYLELGLGFVILKNNRIVSGASSFSRYREGIEIEVDTVESERRKGLASIACAALILECLKRNLYPSWDAQNLTSKHLAEKLGYEFDHEYVVYELNRSES